VTVQALFYEEAVPVSPERHGDWWVDTGAGHAFARRVNSVLLTTVEFESAQREYPIVFVHEDDVVVPVAVLGIEDRQNLFITDSGAWQARYIPAYVRRYPFVFATPDEGGTFTVCIDESFVGCNQEEKGQRLFLPDGGRSPYLDGILRFLQEYQAQYRRTRDFAARLQELMLLEPMTANMALPDGGRRALTGFLAVRRERLKELDVETLQGLVAGGELELMYAHLFSLGNFAALMERLAAASP